MGVTITVLDGRVHQGNLGSLAAQPTQLMAELDRYRRKTERLARIYDLHHRVAEKLDLAAMLEAVSIWLSAQWPHELLGYRHFPRQRGHLVCSTHGPRRQRLLNAAEELMAVQVCEPVDGIIPGDGLQFHLCPLDRGASGDQLLLIHQHPPLEMGTACGLFAEGMIELRGPLDRALAYEELYDQARRDALTGLANRRVFQEQAAQEMALALRYSRPVSLACMDLDYFKAINDRLGHGEGDNVLNRVARLMASRVRESDLLARVGGDEFLLLMPNTGESESLILLNRIRQGVNDLNIQAPGSPPLGTSVGVAAWRPGEALVQWLERADAALYRAKAAGRNQVSL
ncbi:MAG: GGDEF domain-containing protein [Magnetococcales bacterium]|nr:GGDEF domain-containing protein [Magnetococcales bacterium]